MKKPNFKKLSAYTVASNCTDLTDVRAGIEELLEYKITLLHYYKIDPLTCTFDLEYSLLPNNYYRKLKNLDIKKQKLIKKQGC